MTWAVVWPIGAGTVYQCAVPGTATSSCPTMSTTDGATVVGWYVDSGITTKPLFWTGTYAGTYTEPPALANIEKLALVSPDGTIMAGINAGSVFSGQLASRYTSSGASGALLPLLGGGYTTDQLNFYGNSSAFGGIGSSCGISDDGTKLIGTMSGAGTSGALWTNGVVSALSPDGAHFTNASLNCISSDGTTVGGMQASGGFFWPAYWTGSTGVALTWLNTSDQANPGVFFVNVDGTRIYGRMRDLSSNSTAVYWDSLTTLTGTYATVPMYGNVNTLQTLTPGVLAVVNCLSQTGGIAVGYCVDGTGVERACKWTGTTITQLASLPSTQGERATHCSADGSIIVGVAVDSTSKTQPVYWDGSGIHLLPSLSDPTDFFQGTVLGVSRDGTLAYGLVNVSLPPGVPTDLACA